MKLITPFDYWRAGFGLWLAAWQTQIAFNDRIVAQLRPQSGPPVPVPPQKTARRQPAKPSAPL
jgi:hypothetical protein